MAIEPINDAPPQLGGEAAPAVVQQDTGLFDEEQANISGKPPIWASEQPVEEIIAEGEQPVDGAVEKAIEKEVLRAEAIVLVTNIADRQTPEVLTDITTKSLEGYRIDVESRKEWVELNKQIIDLAKLHVEKKTYAGETVANVKYPLIIDACIQFASRAYPELIKGTHVVKGKVIGNDPDGTKYDKAQRISDFMSFQLLSDMDNWEEGVDQLLFTLPAIGCAFKKSYFDTIERKNISELVFADDLVVNYFAKSLERAPRVTHKVYLYHNEIIERITSGTFIDFDIDELGQATSEETSDVDDETPHLFLEQHRWYDLDDDGYQEPYIVTIHAETEKLVRISPRWATDGVIRANNDQGVQDPDGAIIKILPEQYFTRYLFMPSIDGGFYGMGFGSLLMSTNSAINTLMNQLIDAGTLSNRQNGFLGRGLKLGRGKSIQLKSGEWRPVDVTGDDLRKNVFPMPIREPSSTLFQLLGMLIDSGKELAGMTEILAGNSPGANVPAESVLALIEQGLQVYTAVQKRIYRAQYREFSKIRRLNALYLDQMTYTAVLDDPQAIVQSDFSSHDFDVEPVADPNSTTMMQRLLKAKALLELRGQGLDDNEIMRRYLVALDVDDIDSFFPEKPEGGDPAEKFALDEMKLSLDKLAAEVAKLTAETEKIRSDIPAGQVKAAKDVAGIKNDERKLNLEEVSLTNQIRNDNVAESSENLADREYGLETNNQGDL